MGTDKDWEKWGATDPYFGVLSSKNFHTASLDRSTKEVFFASGKSHVGRVIEIIRKDFDPGFGPKSALDFGCGVGRLAIPLADYAQQVVGVDVSRSMLSEAAKNCKSVNVGNVTLIQSSDLTNVSGQFDLVHSYIVFQHINWQRGRVLLQRLAEKVTPGGYLTAHVFTSCQASRVIQSMVRLRYIFPPANWLRNVIRKRPMLEPAMQLHVYDLQAVISDLEARNFDTPLCLDEPTGSEFSGVFLFARRMPTN